MYPPERIRRKSKGFCVFPGYRYCGPGCSGPGAPVNAVDAACKAHDECYRRYGPSCRCDQLFMERLQARMHMNTPEARHARLMHGYMKLKTMFSC
ncbi:phospholipase [Rossellomorea vietnamensis]|uniref:Phospholipase n=2 Tax=Rossellomorea TaxID=2837508 RepID=A0A5D4KFW2_9BACI|nr:MULTISPECIES: phospholipase [Rossellomorea]TYR75143.1 phospholipase [Rossellomorea vietnamensis]TYS79900.1 phospholipase [Rossellomorea aquimaris]